MEQTMTTLNNESIASPSEAVDVTYEDMQQLKNFIFVSIISADNEKYDEEVKQEILRRYDLFTDYKDWEYILAPLGAEAEKYLKILKS